MSPFIAPYSLIIYLNLNVTKNSPLDMQSSLDTHFFFLIRRYCKTHVILKCFHTAYSWNLNVWWLSFFCTGLQYVMSWISELIYMYLSLYLSLSVQTWKRLPIQDIMNVPINRHLVVSFLMFFQSLFVHNKCRFLFVSIRFLFVVIVVDSSYHSTVIVM